MLKFVNEVPVYDFDEACVRFTGLILNGFTRNTAMHCAVTKAAILARAGCDDADAAELIRLFNAHRQFFEDAVSVISLRENLTAVTVDVYHLEEPIFAHWQDRPRQKVSVQAPRRSVQPPELLAVS